MPEFKPKFGLAVMLEQAKKQQEEGLVKSSKDVVEKPKTIQYASPTSVTERIRIIFDDSGSMAPATYSKSDKINDAREGTIEFMRNCTVNQVAVAVHPMNADKLPGEDEQVLATMTCNLPRLSLYVKKIQATGGTPLFETWKKAFFKQPKPTRFIIFSDGSPDNQSSKEELINRCIEDKIPCDTVLIADSYTSFYQEELMQEIASRTGGIYLKFEQGKVDFKKAFKYLSPKLRLALAASNEMQKALMDGKLN